jgi:hypothetical protein
MNEPPRAGETWERLTLRYRRLRTVTASLGPVGEDTAREHVRWLLRGYELREDPAARQDQEDPPCRD